MTSSTLIKLGANGNDISTVYSFISFQYLQFDMLQFVLFQRKRCVGEWKRNRTCLIPVTISFIWFILVIWPGFSFLGSLVDLSSISYCQNKGQRSRFNGKYQTISTNPRIILKRSVEQIIPCLITKTWFRQEKGRKRKWSRSFRENWELWFQGMKQFSVIELMWKQNYLQHPKIEG